MIIQGLINIFDLLFPMFLSRNSLTVTLKARFCYLSCISQSYIDIASMIALSEITRVST